MVACRYCWQCRSNRVNDLVGRCIAEQQTCDQVVAVTLTYAGNVVQSAVIVYPDVQRLMKRLRKAGYKVRYIVAAEYGSKKGRVHWHVVMFFNGKCLDVVTDPAERKPDQVFFPRWRKDDAARINWSFWPHGFAYFQQPDYEGFSYCLKYAVKDQEAEVSTGHISMSKKPPLGYEWFMRRADAYVESRLVPHAAGYAFRHAFDNKGRRRTFWLQGRMRELFLDRFLSRWREVHGGEPPFSEFVTEWEDECVRKARIFSDEELMARFNDPLCRSVRGVGFPEKPGELPPQETGFVVVPAGKEKLLLARYDDGSTRVYFGEEEAINCPDDAALENALRALGVAPRMRNRLLSGRESPRESRPALPSRSGDGGPSRSAEPVGELRPSEPRRKVTSRPVPHGDGLKIRRLG